MVERPKTVGVLGRKAVATLDYKSATPKYYKKITKFRTGRRVQREIKLREYW